MARARPASIRSGGAWALAILGLLAAGCVRDAPRTPAETDARRRLACAAEGNVQASGARASAPPPSEARIAAIRVEGRRAFPEALIREALHTRVGAPLDADVLAQDVRALSALEVFEEVRVETDGPADGLTLVYVVGERPFVDQVFVEGEPPADAGTWFFPVRGDVYDGSAVRRAGAALASRLVHLGHLDATARTHARRVGDRAVDLCLSLAPGPVYRVRKLAFTGNHALDVATLRHALAESLPEKQRTQINVEGGFYRADLIERAQLFLAAAAYDHGLLRWETQEPEVKILQSGAAEGSVEITFPLDEGPVFHVAAITFSGALAAPQAEYDALLDVHPGEVFSRARMIAVKERAEALHLRLGRKDLTIEPGTELDGEQVRLDFHVSRVEASP